MEISKDMHAPDSKGLGRKGCAFRTPAFRVNTCSLSSLERNWATARLSVGRSERSSSRNSARPRDLG